MTGFETVLLRVAGAAAGALVKSLLTRSPGAGLTPDPARPTALWRRPAELGDPEIRRLTRTLASRLGEATAGLPEHERLAAADAVADAFAALGPVDAGALFAADLDPAALAATLPPPPSGLNEAAERLYRDLVRLCCGHAVEYLTTLPGFGARTDVEPVRRTGELALAVTRLACRTWRSGSRAAPGPWGPNCSARGGSGSAAPEPPRRQPGSRGYQTRTEPPRAKAGLVASGGTSFRGSAISETRGPCSAAIGSSAARSKP